MGRGLSSQGGQSGGPFGGPFGGQPGGPAGGPARTREQASFAPFAAMIGLAMVLFLDLAAVLVLPWWAVALLVLAWVPMLVLACRWWTPYPRRLPWIAVVGALLWVAVAIGGNLVF